MRLSQASTLAALLLWLLGLVAAVLARRHRGALSAPRPNQPLMAYALITAVALAAALIFWCLAAMRQPLAETSSDCV
jgi:hypothetical protein